MRYWRDLCILLYVDVRQMAIWRPPTTSPQTSDCWHRQVVQRPSRYRCQRPEYQPHLSAYRLPVALARPVVLEEQLDLKCSERQSAAVTVLQTWHVLHLFPFRLLGAALRAYLSSVPKYITTRPLCRRRTKKWRPNTAVAIQMRACKNFPIPYWFVFDEVSLFTTFLSCFVLSNVSEKQPAGFLRTFVSTFVREYVLFRCQLVHWNGQSQSYSVSQLFALQLFKILIAAFGWHVLQSIEVERRLKVERKLIILKIMCPSMVGLERKRIWKFNCKIIHCTSRLSLEFQFLCSVDHRPTRCKSDPFVNNPLKIYFSSFHCARVSRSIIRRRTRTPRRARLI